MKIGLLSDTHGHESRARKAAELLRKADVGQLIHAGDIGSEEVIYALADVFDFSTTPLTAVWGNVDRYGYPGLDLPQWDGMTIREVSAELTLGGKKIAVAHGDDASVLHRLIMSDKYDFLITGHTHVAEDTMQGSTRMINPGAVYRSVRTSVATLDTDTEKLQLLYL